MESVIEVAKFLLEIFKNEFVPLERKTNFNESFATLIDTAINQQQMAVIDKESGGFMPTDDPAGLMKIDFCKDLMMTYIDTYIVVINAVYNLMEI